MLSSLRRTFCGPNAKERAEINAEFTSTHPQQSDVDFVSACNLPDGELDTFIALQTRSAIADLAELPANYILADHKLDEDLRWNHGWDSLDVVQLTMLLEDHLGIRIYDSEYEQLPGLYFQSCPVVKFVQAVHTLVKPKLTATERAS